MNLRKTYCTNIMPNGSSLIFLTNLCTTSSVEGHERKRERKIEESCEVVGGSDVVYIGGLLPINLSDWR